MQNSDAERACEAPFPFRNALVVVAHPDDETLWAGGLILTQRRCRWRVVCLCRAGDTDRAPRFRRALQKLGADGAMGDVDDGPDQAPLPDGEVRRAVLSLAPAERFDLILTHGPEGEYTRHRRHEEASRAVRGLWQDGGLCAGHLWMFAYEDGGGSCLPSARSDAHKRDALADGVWRAKYELVTRVYGFAPDSFEARTTPRVEGFWCFGSPAAYGEWLRERTGEGR